MDRFYYAMGEKIRIAVQFLWFIIFIRFGFIFWRFNYDAVDSSVENVK